MEVVELFNHTNFIVFRYSGAMNELHMRRNKKSTNATKIDMGRSVDQEHREGRETGRTLTKSNAPFVSSREDRKKEASHCPQRHSLSMTSTKQPKAENTEHFDEKLMDQIEDINSTGCYFLNENDTGYDTPTGKVWSPTKRPGRKKKSKWIIFFINFTFCSIVYDKNNYSC